MKTWVVWTHYECEIGVCLASSVDNGYQLLKGDWLNDCTEDDCGHEPDTMDNSGIASALEYHWDELNYDICEVEVPVATTTVEDIEQMGQTLALIQQELQPSSERMANEKADEILARFRTFQEGS